MLTGETLPQTVRAGDAVHAGAINLSQRLIVRAIARAQDSAMAELARLIETGRARPRALRALGRQGRRALRAGGAYAGGADLPRLDVWADALLRVVGFDVADVGARVALLNAVAVLIITCPCALGLAVPAVQVVATGRLFKRGVLVKSGDALERLAQIDVAVFDKTGTLTLGKPRLIGAVDANALHAAAALARVSRHPLSRALVEAAGPGAAATDAREIAGEGVEARRRRMRARAAHVRRARAPERQ